MTTCSDCRYFVPVKRTRDADWYSANPWGRCDIDGKKALADACRCTGFESLLAEEIEKILVAMKTGEVRNEEDS